MYLDQHIISIAKGDYTCHMGYTSNSPLKFNTGVAVHNIFFDEINFGSVEME